MSECSGSKNRSIYVPILGAMHRFELFEPPKKAILALIVIVLVQLVALHGTIREDAVVFAAVC